MKTIIMNYLKYAVILLLSLSAEAGVPDQNVVNSSGGKLKNNKHSVDFSVGETAINNIGSYTFGVLQPVQIAKPLALENQERKENKIIVYPNPVTDKIHWNIAANEINKVLIFAVSGVKVREAEAPNAEINMASLDNGLYYIQFLDLENKPISVLKIIKN